MIQNNLAVQGRFALGGGFEKEAQGPSFDERFAGALERAVSVTNQQIQAGDRASEAFAAGEDIGLHETVLAVEKADLSLRTFIAVKNRAVEAYQEIMRMQL